MLMMEVYISWWRSKNEELERDDQKNVLFAHALMKETMTPQLPVLPMHITRSYLCRKARQICQVEGHYLHIGIQISYFARSVVVVSYVTRWYLPWLENPYDSVGLVVSMQNMPS